MNLTTAYLQLPFLLAQADTPDPSSTPGSSTFTINGQPATPEQMAQLQKLGPIFGLVGLILALVFIAALWKIFTKAGKPGWASIIPIYNSIVMLEIAGRPIWWIILLIIPGVNLIVLLVVLYDLCKSFGYGIGFFLGMLFLSPIFILILAFGGARYVGPGGRTLAAYPGGYPPATM